MNDIERVLRVARDSIAEKENWTIGTWQHFDATSGRTQFCAMGAYYNAGMRLNVFGSVPYQRAGTILRNACRDLYSVYDVERINDGIGHNAVIRIYDHAIKRAAEVVE